MRAVLSVSLAAIAGSLMMGDFAYRVVPTDIAAQTAGCLAVAFTRAVKMCTGAGSQPTS